MTYDELKQRLNELLDESAAGTLERPRLHAFMNEIQESSDSRDISAVEAGKLLQQVCCLKCKG
ncbi:MAG: hypothetical protein IJM37_10475 [Lachnospiraceae bacterium]|nr:hypothetical protein [Lachnospiraceae bacterium]